MKPAVVPLRPKETTTGEFVYPGAAVELVALPQTVLAAAFAKVAVTAPVEELLLNNAPSPEKELTPPVIVLQPSAPVAVVKVKALVAALQLGNAAFVGSTGIKELVLLV